MKLSSKIKKYASMFETIKRGEEDITIFAKNASQELHDSVMKAHGDRLPSDWIFEKYESILMSLCDYNINSIDDLDEYRSELIDSLVDVYTSDLTEWLNSSNDNVYYLTQAQEEFGETDGFKLLSMAQYLAISDIFSYVEELLHD